MAKGVDVKPVEGFKPIQFRSSRIEVITDETGTKLTVNVEGVTVLRAFGCHIDIYQGVPKEL